MIDIEELKKALEPLVAIADAYDDNDLDDEARKFWGLNSEHQNTIPPKDIELYTGRGGKRLLTLEHCLAARRAVRGPRQYIPEVVTFMGVKIEDIKRIRLIKPHGPHKVGEILKIRKIIPHGGNYDCEGQFVTDDGYHIPSDKAGILD